MGEIRVRGPKAFEVVQKITCNDVAALVDGRIQYSAFLTEKGTFVDDLLTYRIAEDDYLLVVNASNTPKDVAWAKSFAVPGATIEDESPAWSQIAIQGPLAQEILQPFVPADLGKVAYYWFTWADVLGARCIVSRTGYTGEDGFEVYGPAEAAPKIWNALLEAGGPKGLLPAGLGARDTLRLEAKLALYGNDIDDTVTPWEADLGWIVKMKKGDFVGREALARQKEAGLTRKLAGFFVEGRGIARHGYPSRSRRRASPASSPRAPRPRPSGGRSASRTSPRGHRRRDPPPRRRARQGRPRRRRPDPVLQASLSLKSNSARSQER
jgi:Glycine cleavage system T protein (aminomethyltransferase)